VNDELVAKLDSEIRLEEDQKEYENYRSTIQEYLDNSPYKLHDTPGQEEVVLTRDYNGEKYFGKQAVYTFSKTLLT